LPPHQADDYKSCWREYYFTPMRRYFAEVARRNR
jgi:hypothetical protein